MSVVIFKVAWETSRVESMCMGYVAITLLLEATQVSNISYGGNVYFPTSLCLCVRSIIPSRYDAMASYLQNVLLLYETPWT